MLALVDYRTDGRTIENLHNYADEIYLFRTEGITYNSISGHPDIFIYQDENVLIAAPNIPFSLFEFFNKHSIQFSTGEAPALETFESSVRYNCLSTKQYFFHKKGFTEKKILEANKDKVFINLPQAYTRCSLIYLRDDRFITSDKGIEKELLKNNFNCFYFDPSEIIIADHKHGFIGGTAGVSKHKILFNGDIKLHTDGIGLQNFINDSGFEIVCLGSHKLYDGGGIFFIE